MNLNIGTSASNNYHPSISLPPVGQTIPVHCVIRSDNTSDTPTFITLNWKVTGARTLRLEETNLTINSASNFRPGSGRRWYIMGIFNAGPGDVARSGYLGFNTANGEIDYSGNRQLRPTVSGGQVYMDIPFGSKWIELEQRNLDGAIPGNGHFGGGLSTASFKPLGTLLRFNFGNDTPGGLGFNTFYTRSKNFNPHGLFQLNVPVGSEVGWRYTSPMPAQGWEFTYAITGGVFYTARGTSTSYYPNHFCNLWVMPNGNTFTGADGLTLLPDVVFSGGTMKLPTTKSGTTKVPQKGRSYTYKTLVTRPKMAIEYTALYNLSHTPGVLAGDNSTTSSGYYNRWDSGNVPAGYHLPTLEEFYAIVGPGFTFSNTGLTGHDLPITVAGQNYTWHNQWYASGNGVAYGLRFLATGATAQAGFPPYPNQWMLCAYRYQVLGSIYNGSPDARLQVRVRYLGPYWQGNMSSINNDAFWTNVEAPIEVIREFPLAGWMHTNGTTLGDRGMHWYYRFNGYGAAGLSWYSASHRPSFSRPHLDDANRFSVRPFSNN